MKIKLKASPEQIELIKQVGSKNNVVSAEASEAFAAFLGTVIQKVLNQAGTTGMIYKDTVFDEDDSPSYPLDLYYDTDSGYITVWSQTIAGGMPTSQVEGVAEMKIATYRLDTAVSFLKKYARKSRLDVVTKAVERMAQEVLLRQERNGWAVVLKAAAEAASLNGRASASGSALKHVIRANTAGTFLIDDLSKLITRVKRINVSFANGTPASEGFGLTDLVVSPEIKEQIRGFAYNPLNTRQATSGTTSIPLPDNIREQIYRAAGTSEIFGVNITDLVELGVGQKYNTLFDTLAGSTAYKKADGTGSAAFNGAAEEILVGLDLSKDAFIRAVARQSDSGGTFTVQSDDQFVSRQDKVGFYGFLEEGRVCIDARAVCGIIV